MSAHSERGRFTKPTLWLRGQRVQHTYSAAVGAVVTPAAEDAKGWVRVQWDSGTRQLCTPWELEAEMMSQESSTALAPLHSGPRAVTFRHLDDVERFAELVYKSSLVPKEYRGNKADVIGVIMFGAEIGLNAMAALQNVSWISGKPAVYGDMMLAMVEATGLLEQFGEVEPEEAQRTGVGRCSLKRRGRVPIVRAYTKDMADKAKLCGKAGPWTEHPGRMLQLRARGWALRDAFADVLKGLYTVEEARDIELRPDDSGAYAYTPPAEPSPPSGPADEAPTDEPVSSGGEPSAAPAEAIAEAMLAEAGLVDQPARPEPTTGPALERAIAALLRQLAPGDDDTARQERRDLMQACWGKDRYRAMVALDEQPLRAGWAKLQAMRPMQPPAVEAPRVEAEDVPTFDAPEPEVSTAELEALRQRYDAAGWGTNYDARRVEVDTVTRPLYEEWLAVVEGLERMAAKAPARAGEG